MYSVAVASRCRIRSFVALGGLNSCRRYSATAQDDVRARLTSELKNAMKNKDSFASTTLRSVLAEIQAADKQSPDQKIGASSIVSIIRKATQRRNDAAEQFVKSSRPDLAEKERKEVELLSSFLPPLLPESEIDRLLREAMDEQVSPGENPHKASGKIYKAFYSKVDKSLVDPDLVKRRAEALLKGHQ